MLNLFKCNYFNNCFFHVDKACKNGLATGIERLFERRTEREEAWCFDFEPKNTRASERAVFHH